ncbi:surfactant protein C-like [Anolis sagrei]|uniref:surfactant protein C-like n=1 Tax=Anolis sagrei TaxID=38937 RepID=UPI003522E02A
MEKGEKMEVEMETVTKQKLIPEPSLEHLPPLPPEPGCCPCCGCCGCCDCCGCCESFPLPLPGLGGCCPGCGSCPGCCCCPCCGGGCCRLLCSLPKLLCRLPQLPSCPINIKRFLIILIVVVVVVVIIVAVLLMGLFVTQGHTQAVLQMTIEGHGGDDSWLNLPTDTEEVATFEVDDGIRGPAAIIYDFGKLLIGYKPWHGAACFLTKMDKENVQGLDAAYKGFQKEESMNLTSLVDRSNLGTTLNILCSHVPVFWA